MAGREVEILPLSFASQTRLVAHHFNQVLTSIRLMTIKLSLLPREASALSQLMPLLESPVSSSRELPSLVSKETEQVQMKSSLLSKVKRIS